MRFPLINWYFLHHFPLPIILPSWVCDKLVEMNKRWLRHSLYFSTYPYLTFVGQVGVPKDSKTWKMFFLVFIYHFNIKPIGEALGFSMPNLVTVELRRK